MIENQRVCDVRDVVREYEHIKQLQTNNLDNRGWLFDVLNCINLISADEFCLEDVYHFTEQLQERHANNHNIQAKIRQQLQILRDKGFIEFLGRGHYRKIR